jgi:predicted dehydrogenase
MRRTLDTGVPVSVLANARGPAHRPARSGHPRDHRLQGRYTLLAELEGFAAAVRGERAYPVPPEDILYGVAVFEAIVRSAERHQPVTVART